MKPLLELERKVQGYYAQRLKPLCERFGVEAPEHHTGATGTPSVLFLGNHSSGKSSFINYLLGQEVQKTGLAPVDDGFTIITYGSQPDQLDGQSVVTHAELPYRPLERFGPDFLARLRLKTRPLELLKRITLIDSPGMIDAPDRGLHRGYDFAASVRFFAEHADLILFFFDPDKPGTTGETMTVFTQSLVGQEHKLLILLHKVDLFQNIRDFARTYGTLCWNLSKTIRTKDMPHIYVTHLPQQAAEAGGRIPLDDFDQAREEVVSEIERAPVRRADNLVSGLYHQARRLAMLARVCMQTAARYRRLRRRWVAGITAGTLALAALTWWTAKLGPWTTALWIGLAGAALVVAASYFARYKLRQFRAACTQPESLEDDFRLVYTRELAWHDRADLEALWDQVRGQVAKTLELNGPQHIPHSHSTRRLIRQVERLAEEEVPKLRRNIADYQRQQETLRA